MTEEAGSPNPVQPGSSSPTWRESLSADLKDNPVLTRFNDVSELAKEHVNVQSLIGRKGVIKPKEDDPNDVRRYYTEIGCPESWDKYEDPKVQIPEVLAPFFQVEKLQSMKKLAHELGVPKGAFEKMAEVMLQNQVNEFSMLSEQSAGELKQNEAALRKEWGMAYDQKVTLAKKVSETYGTSELEQEFLAMHGSNPALISIMSKVGKDISEDIIVKARAANGVQRMTPQEAMTEANRLMASEAFLNGQHPENASAKQRVNDLFKMAR